MSELNENPVPPLLLERLARDELPEPKKTEVLERLQREAGGMERLDELRASDAAILSEIPPARFRSDLDQALGRSKAPRWLTLALPMAAAASAVVALVPFSPDDPVTGPNGVETTRTKGDSSARLVVLRGESRLADGDSARAGDLLSFMVQTSSPVYAVLVARDGSGAVSAIAPEAGSAIRITPNQPLPVSYELDDAPDFERFYLVTSSSPFDLSSVVDEVRSRPDSVSLPDGLVVDRFEVKKSPWCEARRCCSRRSFARFRLKRAGLSVLRSW